MINKDRIIKTFCEIVAIDSPSGEEESMAIDVTNRLENFGFSVIRDDYGNVIASDGRENPILLSAHLDTVEPGRGITPIVKDDQIVSDGTTILGGDCKSGIVAVFEALESMLEDGIPMRPVELVFTREEELGLVGARNLDMSTLKSKQAIIFDGEGPVNQITSSSPTYIGFDINITGRAAHAGAEPEKGLSAISIAADIISQLPQGRLDNNTTFNIGNVEGGSTRNTVPENTLITGEFRSTNLEKLDDIREQIDNVINKVKKKYPEAVLESHMHTSFETYTLEPDDPATQTASEALEKIGLPPIMKPSGGGTDGNVFRNRGISSVVVGMAVHGMHTVREYVNIPDLIDTAHFCESLLREDTN